MGEDVNLPKLRFPEFSANWDMKNGNEVFDSISNKKHNSDLPILAISQEHGAVPRELIDYKISVTEKSVESYKVVEKGDFIISLRSFQGGIEYSEYLGICSPAYIILKPKIEINDYFYKYYLKSSRYITELNRKLEGIRDGKMISYSYFSDIKLPYPSVIEQTKIASFLTAVDHKLQALKKKKELLEQYKKGMMQQLFSQEIRFKKDDGTNYPDWEEKKLGEVTYKVDKKNKTKEKLPIYSISNQNGFVPQSEQFEGLDSNERGYDISLYKVVQEETFAYNPARINVGSIGYSGKDKCKVIISSLYICFKTIDIIDDYYFQQFLKTSHFKDSVLRNGEGGVRIYLFFDKFSEISINIPCIQEQTKIANFLSALDDKITHCQSELDGLEQWKKGLLQQMFC